MYTAFVSDCKSALSGLWEQVQKIHQQEALNDTRYQGEYLTEQNARLEQQKRDAIKSAKERINAIMDKADKDAAALDEITPLDIDPDSKADRRIMELLSGKFTLNAAQLQALLDKFIPKDNRALLNAVRTFAEVRGMRVIAATTESRRAAIASIKADALGIVSRVENTSYKNTRKQGTFEFDVDAVIRNFCVDGDFARATGIYGRLGQRYDGALLSPTVEGDGFDFRFRGVRDGDKKAG